MSRISLNENEHIEWTKAQKLMQVNTGRKAVVRRWRSLNEKLEMLCEQARGDCLVGVAAREALTVGSDKNLMWVDVDTCDTERVERWLKEQTLFPQGSYLRLDSSTWHSHVYITTDVPLQEKHQLGMKSLIRSTMDETLARTLDRVYGPFSHRIVFLPKPTMLRAELPGRLTRGLTEEFCIPTERVLDPVERVVRRLHVKT